MQRVTGHVREDTQNDEYNKHNITLRSLGMKEPGAVDYPGTYAISSQYSGLIIYVTARGLLDLADLINERSQEIERWCIDEDCLFISFSID